MEKELFSKEWGSNIAKAAKAIVMLDMITTAYEKSREMKNRRLKAFIDNRELGKMVNGSIEIANHYNQNRVAEVIAIKRLIDECPIVIEVERIQAHKEIRGIF